jgi:hypothetical protein
MNIFVFLVLLSANESYKNILNIILLGIFSSVIGIDI